MRVGVVLNIEHNIVYFLGYGELVENGIPMEAKGINSEVCKYDGEEVAKVKLDSGDIVYGSEATIYSLALLEDLFERDDVLIEEMDINEVRANQITIDVAKERKKIELSLIHYLENNKKKKNVVLDCGDLGVCVGILNDKLWKTDWVKIITKQDLQIEEQEEINTTNEYEDCSL